ncbi:MAG: NAD(P)/FAD-dependent oxidoreductase [Sphingomonadales bacterium]
MKTEFLLVGQGLCGTWLSYFLEQEKREFLVLDPGGLPNASRQAGGLINPVTGRRLVTTWLIDELLPFAISHYGDLSQLLLSHQKESKKNLIEERDILQFFAHPNTRSIFETRAKEQPHYLQPVAETLTDLNGLDPLHGYGIIKKGCQVRSDLLLETYQKKLLQSGHLRQEKFDYPSWKLVGTKNRYKDIDFEYLIFCDGIGAHDNSLFAHLPFAPVKGQALILRIPELSPSFIFKGPLTMIPMGTSEHWWVGSSYEWSFKDSHPSADFRNATEQTLRHWLKLPFTITDHWAAIRPGSKERRPFVGMLEENPSIGILGGMGTKGCSLAPYFANQLVEHLLRAKPLHPEATLARFRRN